MDERIPMVYDRSNGATVAGFMRQLIALPDVKFSECEYQDLQYLASQSSDRNSLFQLEDHEAQKLIGLVEQHMPELLMDSRLTPPETHLHPKFGDMAIAFAKQHYVRVYAQYLEHVSLHWSPFKIERYFLWKYVERSQIPKPISNALGLILYHVDFILDAASMAHELARLFWEYGQDRELFVARLHAGNDDNRFVMEFVQQHAD